MSSTYSEITSQPSIWKKVLEKNENEIPWIHRKKKNSNTVLYFIGCGTSYYLALAAASVYSRITGMCTRAMTSSDLLFFPESIPTNQNINTVAISRSGETTETVWAADYLVKNNIPTFALTCEENSSLGNLAHESYAIKEAQEESVVMTRSFTNMLLFLQRMAAIDSNNTNFLSELNRLPEYGANIISEYSDIMKAISALNSYSMVTFLGQGAYYGLACESMLKLKEMSLTTTEVFHSLEFRHGPKAGVNDKSLIIFLLSKSARDQEMKLALELKEQGAKVVMIGDNIPIEYNTKNEYTVSMKTGLSEYARLILYMPLTQLFAYERAILKGLDPDVPTNLSKIVFLANE